MDSALSAADVHAEHLFVELFKVEAGVLYGEVGSGGREVKHAVGAADLFFVEPVFGIEIFNLSGYLRGVLFRVEERDVVYAVLPALKRAPELFFSDSDWGDGTATCDYHSSVIHRRHRFPPWKRGD